MKVIYFTKYTRKGASSRLRSYQYFPFFEENGVEIEVYPLFDDKYLTNLYEGKKSILRILQAYLQRFVNLVTIKKSSVVVIEYELFPYLPAWIEWFLMKMRVKYIVDYDDAIFHNYDLSKNKIIRFFLKDKITKVMKYSSAVVAGNEYLAEKARKSGASTVDIIPTVVDICRYAVKTDFNCSKDSTLIVGWIGTFSTLKFLKRIIPVLENISRDFPLSLQVIGAKENIQTTLDIQFIPWTEETEASGIRNFDIGIMPLSNTPWERGKCGYKLIQYMASGLPVIASAVGVNTKIVKHGINGFIANTPPEWTEALLYFIKNRDRIPEMGRAGRKTVETSYSVQKTNADWLKIIKGV